MIELVNVIIAAVAGFILGLTIHSAFLHSRKRGELKDWHKIIRGDEKGTDEAGEN